MYTNDSARERGEERGREGESVCVCRLIEGVIRYSYVFSRLTVS